MKKRLKNDRGEEMTKEELQEKLKLHKLWLENKEGERLDLTGADLSGADLNSADLRRADLKDANLTGADLRYADFRFADLKGANLSGANLNNCIGNRKEIKTIQTSKYWIVYTKDVMQIGCENHTIDKWFQFSDDRISKMGDDALEWWKVWKPILKKIIKANRGKK